ncbi:MAG: sugar phosphate isomerase/epimerase [Gemmatimonadaceae bacterium]|nr:sugar phosphate isomerase/epimerase [Gemmatimonadaceae bacterium]
MSSRRDAVKTLAALVAAGLLPRTTRAASGAPDAGASDAGAPDAIERIGLQLYTVRSLMNQDMPGTMAAVAAAGYREVEFAGYFRRTPSEVRQLLNANGLTSPSTHLGLADVGERFGATADAAQAIGIRYLTVASLDMRTIKSADDWKRTADAFNDAGRRAKAAGLRFAYHNHAVEFTPVDGVVPMDLLVGGTDPSLVAFELDLFWAIKAGQDPRAYFAKHPGRFEMVHVKDATAAPAGEMTDVGSGVIDWKGIFAAHTSAGIRHYFVEHDGPADPMQSIRRSADYLKTLRF